ncbi:unnamed protein product [Alternaria alternata]
MDHHDLPSEKTSSTGAYELLQARIDNDDESKYGFWGELGETKSSSEIKFCLESPNREAPSAQVWRYMRAATGDSCATDTIDFILDPKEAWKVQPGASLVLRNEQPYLDQIEKTQTPTVSREQVQVP